MKARYHRAITLQALQDRFSPAALETILRASQEQDVVRNQIGHPEFHFDDSHFKEGLAYMEAQRAQVAAALAGGSPPAAWAAFGRLIHAGQDFYAHSNYVRLWLEARLPEGARLEAPGAGWPQPAGVDPLDPSILNHPRLHSGRVYYPWEILSFIPLLEPLMVRLLPADSHACMNLDRPERGPLFPYAFHAAIARTRHEFAVTAGRLEAKERELFAGIVPD